jgi:hypothetical protein
MSKHAEEIAKVLEFVAENPHCTAKDIAIKLFGGDGKKSTTSRTKANTCLVELEDLGKLRRTPSRTPRNGAEWRMKDGQPVVTDGGHALYPTLKAMCRANGVRRARLRGQGR